MKFKKQTIAFQDTNYFSKIAIDYIHKKEKLQPFIQAFPDKESLAKQIFLKQQQQIDRVLLQEVITQQYAEISMHEAVSQNVALLSNTNTFTICTAHQPCIFTGPLYIIYKITHAIKLAKTCKQLLPNNHFVPVFYIGSEDNDLEEIGTMHLYNETLTWNTPQTGACGSMNTADLSNVTKEVLAVLDQNIIDEKWLAQLINQAYGSNLSLTAATRIMLNGLFASYGLLILDANEHRFKKVFAPIMKDELLRQQSAIWVSETGKQLSEFYKVQATGREINLFYLKDQLRARIEKKGDRWTVHNTDLSMNESELLSEIERHPEHFSPNVILRPLYQEMILPNIAFIGGGGELAYWLELKKIFDQYQVPYPIILLRNSFLLIDYTTIQRIDKAQLTLSHLFIQTDALNKLLLANHESLTQLDEKLASIHTLLLDIEKLSATININLETSMKAHHAKALKVTDRIKQKFISQLKQKETAKLQAVSNIKQTLFPANSLQERYDNFIPMFKKYGKNLIATLIEMQEGIESAFIILTEDKNEII